MAAVGDLIMPLLRGLHPGRRLVLPAALEQELACRNLALAIYG